MFVYFVSVSTSDPDLGALSLFSKLNGFSETKIKSKVFNDYKSCVDSAHRFITDIVNELKDAGHEGFFIHSVTNPQLTDEENQVKSIGLLSTWSNHEMIRFYLMNQQITDEFGNLVTKLVVSILSKPEEKEN